MGRRQGWGQRPEKFHAPLALAVALTVALALLIPFRHNFGWYHVLAAWLLAVNLTTFAWYALDKSLARHGVRRVPERVLHGLALAGGSFGAWLAMRTFRHKTVKGNFRLAFWLIVVLQVLLVAWVVHHIWNKK